MKKGYIFFLLMVCIILIGGCVSKTSETLFAYDTACQIDLDCSYVSNYGANALDYSQDPEGIPIPVEWWDENTIIQIKGACVNLDNIDKKKDYFGQDFIIDENVPCKCVEQSDVFIVANGTPILGSTDKNCIIKEKTKPDMKLLNVTHELVGEQEINGTLATVIDFSVYYANVGEAGCGEVLVQIEGIHNGIGGSLKSWLYECAIDPEGDCFDPGEESYNNFQGFFYKSGNYKIMTLVECSVVQESNYENNAFNLTIAL